MIAITGATGQLGCLTIASLLKKVSPSQIVALVRNPAKASDLSAQGVIARKADYDDQTSLDDALQGVNKVLLISSNEIGQRTRQHTAVIDAARKNNVRFIAYTSLLHADSTPLGLKKEHLETEAALRQSGIPHAILRNGWYTENQTANLAGAVAHGAIIGNSGEGKFSAATRADYAEAASVVLATESHNGRVYELAGDTAYTRAEFAAEIARLSGKPVAYKNMSEEEHRQALLGFGLPAELAELIADSDTGAAQGALFDDGSQLSTLIGRPSTPWQQTVRQALAE
jgi:NAD(P)H dehydrogenase (quinone)